MPEKAIPELKSAVEIAAELTGESKETSEPVDPRDATTFVFKFSHTDARGKIWSGKFTNHILTVRQRRLMKITKAQLAGGVPLSALDADAWELNECIAHLAVSLDRAADGFPKWAENLEDLYDETIIFKLYTEVASHEARFHRRGTDHSVGERAAENG